MKINALKTKTLRLLTGLTPFIGIFIGTKAFGQSRPPQPADVPIDTIGGVVAKFKLVVDWVQYVFFAVAILFIIMAAFAYLTSGGDEEKVRGAKNKLLYAVIAIAVALLAYAMIRIVVSFFGGNITY